MTSSTASSLTNSVSGSEELASHERTRRPRSATVSGPKNWDRHGRQGVGNLEEGEKGGYPERREYARRRLLEWASKARVVDEIARRYQVDPRTASRDVRAVWEAVAEEQSSSRVAETARAIALLEDQIERVQASDERATAKARAISDLVDRLARLGGL